MFYVSLTRRNINQYAALFYFAELIRAKEMQIMFDSDLTRHLAVLSKLSFTDAELEKMTADMGDIIQLMDKVCEFDPFVKPYTLDEVNYKDLRRDVHNPSSEPELIVKNSHNVRNNSFVVPKVV